MLSEPALEEYFAVHKVTEEAREYIRTTRAAPSRVVGENARRNVCTAFISEKTQCTIQTESRTGEYAVAVELEYASDVIEYWDQAEVIPILRTYHQGRRRQTPYRPDFLVLRDSGPQVLEVKLEQQIQMLLSEHASDWQLIDNQPVFLPAQEALAAIGLTHIVVSTASRNLYKTSNLRLLLQSREKKIDTSRIENRVEAIFNKQAWMRLSELAHMLNLVDLTPILALIDRRILYASLDDELLTQPESAWIVSDPTLLKVAKDTTRSGGATLGDSLQPTPVSRIPNAKEAKRVLDKLSKIKANSRSARRWRKKLREGLAAGLNEFQALISSSDKSGNRTKRLNSVVERHLRAYIRGELDEDSLKAATASGSYAVYRESASRYHPQFPPVSWPMFCKRRRFEDQSALEHQRGGRRAANAAATPSDVMHRQLPVQRAFERGTLDHYLANISCRVLESESSTFTAHPWISVLSDLGSDEILAVWLSFRHPSRRACAMIVRECVRRHGRLPEGIVVDHGPEFQSVYFSALAAHCRVELIQRPPENPRYGSEAERIFGIFITQWLSMRPGYAPSNLNARAVSASHASRNLAELTIHDLLTELSMFIDWYNAHPRGLHELPPSELSRRGMAQFSCSGREIDFNQEFMIATAIESSDYKIDGSRGLHSGDTGLHYWHPSLNKAWAKRGRTEVRKEPEDPYRVYAKVENEWVTCLATHAREFDTKDPVARLAEAIRINDGREIREAAKEQADYTLINKLRSLDTERAASKPTSAVTQAAVSSNGSESSVFDRLRSRDVTTLDSSKWGG